MNKTIVINQEVGPGQHKVERIPSAGSVWKVSTLTGSCVYDGTSVGFYLTFGSEPLSAFIVTGEPFLDIVDREIEGDGTTPLTLTIVNFGQDSRRVTAALRASKRAT